MAYDYQSRQKLVEAYRAKWKRKLLLVPGEIKEAAEEMGEIRRVQAGYPDLSENGPGAAETGKFQHALRIYESILPEAGAAVCGKTV